MEMSGRMCGLTTRWDEAFSFCTHALQCSRFSREMSISPALLYLYQNLCTPHSYWSMYWTGWCMDCSNQVKSSTSQTRLSSTSGCVVSLVNRNQLGRCRHHSILSGARSVSSTCEGDLFLSISTLNLPCLSSVLNYKVVRASASDDAIGTQWKAIDFALVLVSPVVEALEIWNDHIILHYRRASSKVTRPKALWTTGGCTSLESVWNSQSIETTVER
jgi:hypothetical protein